MNGDLVTRQMMIKWRDNRETTEYLFSAHTNHKKNNKQTNKL